MLISRSLVSILHDMFEDFSIGVTFAATSLWFFAVYRAAGQPSRIYYSPNVYNPRLAFPSANTLMGNVCAGSTNGDNYLFIALW